MSESYREQFPLLCDDLSDEEHYSPHYHRQYRQMTYRSRAKGNVKGAVAILKRWPEHWSSFLAYWWIGVVMICLMTFILYNSLFALSMLPTAQFKPLKAQTPTLNTVQYTSQEISQFPNVYMHIFTDDNNETDLKKYLPHIESMANKYSNFNYHLVVVINDTSLDSQLLLSPEENNINALNSLWTKDIVTRIDKPRVSNIWIEYISLTKYMDNSPVNKYWRTLSNDIIKFLVRAISIWDKSGITFNPVILTPQSPYPAYDKTLENVFNIFGTPKSADSFQKKNLKPSNLSQHKFKHKVNNIRDVIEALEHDNESNVSHNEILAEVETINSAVFTPKLQRRSITINSKTNQNFTNTPSNKENNSNLDQHINSYNAQAKTLSSSNDSSILPSFLDYLFRHSTMNNQDKVESSEVYIRDAIKYVSNEKSLNTDVILENKNNSIPITKDSNIVNKKSLSPMIISANDLDIDTNEIKKDSSSILYLSKSGIEDQNLTIDIKGNLLATKTACHAFLGTIFTDAIHCEHQEKLTDFIVKELSRFCNGVLSSCSGIDIIIL